MKDEEIDNIISELVNTLHKESTARPLQSKILERDNGK